MLYKNIRCLKSTNKGAISIFALLSMMFFLIFITVTYNNIMQKAKTQVETESILVDSYKYERTSKEIINSINQENLNGLLLSNRIKESSNFNSKIIDTNANKYIYSNGKLYKIESPTYQQVEYIESTGTQYIDTLYKPGPNTGIEVKYQFMSLTQQQRIFGVFGDDSYNNSLTYTIYISGGDVISNGFKNGGGNWQWSDKRPDLNIHSISFNIPVGKWVYDGSEMNANTGLNGSPKTNTAINNMVIMAGRLINNSVTYYANIRIYSFKVYENNNLVRDFIPCYRKSDSVIGMYDLANDVFYINSGTGTFLKGPNVTY